MTRYGLGQLGEFRVSAETSAGSSASAVAANLTPSAPTITATRGGQLPQAQLITARRPAVLYWNNPFGKVRSRRAERHFLVALAIF